MQLKAVVFDWAGTIVDHGSQAPMGAFVEAFAEFGVSITVAEARGPMGIAKRPHVAALLHLPRVAAEWQRVRGHPPTEADIDAVYDVFVPKNISVVAAYSQLIPGAAEIAGFVRARGLKIGTTTGYTREIMNEVVPVAARGGFTADAMACTGDAPDGRPSPLLYYRVLLDLEIWPAWATVKVDDTEVGIAEGLNAGAWTVGVALTGNLVGLAREDLAARSADEVGRLRAGATGKMRAAGAHYVIDGVADLLPVIDDIEGRLVRGDRP